MKLQNTLMPNTDIHISQNVLNKVNYLHTTVPKNLEWSGVLIFRDSGEYNTNGTPKHVGVFDIIPLNIGNATYTEHMMNCESVVDYIMCNPDKEFFTGLIHSHHNMETGFSGQDISELNTNSDKYQYYLSLIVNYNGRYNAKIGVCSKQVSTTIKYIRGKEVNFPSEPKKVVDIYPCNIVYPIPDLDVSFLNSVVSMENKYEEDKKKIKPSSINPFLENYRLPVIDYKPTYKPKYIPEMDVFMAEEWSNRQIKSQKLGEELHDLYDREPEPTDLDYLNEDLDMIKETILEFENDLKNYNNGKPRV